jgi:hypothetical protein
MLRPAIPIPIALALLAACARPHAAEPPERPAAAAPADSVVRPAAIPKTYTLFDSATVDVDGDGVKERVDLASTTVGRGSDGQLEWDHINGWLVAVIDGDTTYPLLQEGLPGDAAFWIIRGQPDSERADSVAILVQTSILTAFMAGTRLDRFVFDRARGGFVRTGRVEAWGRGEYRGPPEPGGVLVPTPYRGTIDYDRTGRLQPATPAPAPRP